MKPLCVATKAFRLLTTFCAGMLVERGDWTAAVVVAGVGLLGALTSHLTRDVEGKRRELQRAERRKERDG